MRSLPFLLSGLILGALSHICLEQPPQDGGFPATALVTLTPQCGSFVPPCGNGTFALSKRNIPLPLLGGVYESVLVVMNNQHLGTPPGTVDLSICFFNATVQCTLDSQFVTLTSCLTLDVFVVTPATINFTISLPNRNVTMAILRVRYLTNTGINYYSCSTISLQATTNSPAPPSGNCSAVSQITSVPQTSAPISPIPPFTPLSPGNLGGGSGAGSQLLLGYPVLYVGIGIGVVALVLISVVVIVVVGIVLFRKRDRGGVASIATRNKGSIPTMSLAEIQSTRMQVPPTMY